MAKRKQTKSQSSSLPAVQNAAPEPVQNGMNEAVGFNQFGLPASTSPPFSEQITSTDTLFKNLRYYLVSNFRQVLSQAYVEIGLVQTVVDVPVDDGMRGGIEWKSGQLNEDQIKELKLSMKRDGDLRTAAQAAKWTRLFGGGAIIVMLDDQDPEEPLDLDAITPDSGLEFRAVDMWELYWNKQNLEEFEDETFEHYDYHGEKIHKSRVMKLKGIEAPSFIRPRLRGWGVSVVEILIRSINQYLKSSNLGFEVLDEFKLDVYKMKNLLNTLLSPNGTQKIKERVQLANWQKNYQNAIVMDAEDDFDHKQLSFAGLAEAIAGIRMQVAADMRMPITKLFGTSVSAGFSTDQNDMENYNSMVESQVRDKLEFDLTRMAQIKCQALFGMIPDDLEGEFAPLRVLSATDEETVKTSKFARLKAAKDTGDLTTLEFREACNRDNLFPIQLDTKLSRVNPDDPQVAEVLAKPLEQPVAPGAEEGGEEKPGKEPTKEKPVTNEIYTWSQWDKTVRLLNSAEFDKASYEADGGDDWIHPGRKEIFSDPRNVDEALWARAKDASQKALGEIRWQFVTWWYRKQGGQFK